MFDLHLHSTYSDGRLSIQELATMVRQKKLAYCALTDHNSVDGFDSFVKCLDGSGIKIIPATELTARYDDNEVHLLAYDFDVDRVAEILRERNDIVQHQKINEMEIAKALFREEGFFVDDALKPIEKYPVGLTVALNVCANDRNQEILFKKHGRRFSKEDVYFEYQAPGRSCAGERSGVDVRWIVEKFKEIARDLIIAHPFVSVSVVTRSLHEAEISQLLGMGLSGIEVYHDNTSNEQINLLNRLVRERHVHYTGGSDFHGKGMDTPIGQYDPIHRIPDFILSNYRSDKL